MANETINFLIDDDQEIVSFNTGEGTTTDFLSGVGTPTYLPKYESGQILGDSIMYEDTGVSINVEGKFSVDTTSTSTSLSEDTTSLVTIDRSHTAVASGSVHGSKTTLNGNSSFLDGGVVGSVTENFQNGSGGAFYSYGSTVKSRQYGSGNISFLSGQVIWVAAQADATAEIDYIRGISVDSKLNSAFTTVNNLQGTHQTVDLVDGTAGEVVVCLLDIDRTGATVTGNISYLQMQADEGFHDTTGGTARSIYSQNTLPSEFNGSISTPLLLNESENSLITSGYAYGIKSKVTNKQTTGAPSIVASRAEAAVDTTVSSGSIYGTNSKAMSYGTGDAGFLIGTYSTAENMNEGNVTGAMYGSWSQSRSRGAAAVDIESMWGSVNRVMTENDNATIGNVAVSYAEVYLTAGTVLRDVNVIEANIKGIDATIGGDLSMLYINDKPAPTTVTGTTRAIDSRSTFPSFLGGDLKVSGALNVGTTGDHADNAAAITAGLAVGDIYRTGDLLKVVH